MSNLEQLCKEAVSLITDCSMPVPVAFDWIKDQHYYEDLEEVKKTLYKQLAEWLWTKHPGYKAYDSYESYNSGSCIDVEYCNITDLDEHIAVFLYGSNEMDWTKYRPHVIMVRDILIQIRDYTV